MTLLYAIPLALLLGAFGRRWLGGLISQWFPWWPGTMAGRALWGVCMIGVGLLAGAPWWISIIAGMGYPIGLCIYGDAPGMAMANAKDAALLVLHGFCVAAIASACVWWIGGLWWLPLAAGVACPVFYAAAYRWPVQAAWLGCLRVDPPPTAECTWGAACALGLFLGLAT